MKKQSILFMLLGVGLVSFFTFWMISENKKDAYESYLSDRLVGQIARISSLPNYHVDILENIIKKGIITKPQAEELQLGFQVMVFEIQELSYMGTFLGRLENFSDDVLVDVINDYGRFFKKFEFAEARIELTDEQLNTLIIMKNAMEKFNEVVQETLHLASKDRNKGQSRDFFEYYEEKGIEDEDWVELLKGYEKVTDVSFRIN